jgi:hypothetical protein
MRHSAGGTSRRPEGLRYRSTLLPYRVTGRLPDVEASAIAIQRYNLAAKSDRREEGGS